MTLADELVKKWQHVLDQCKIPTWTEPWCLAYCAEVASESRHMVEIGTYLGASAEVMLKANPDLHLWCVDIFSAFTFNLEIAHHLLRPYIQEGRCELIQGTSTKAAEMLSFFRDVPAGLDAVWIDGAHDAINVKKDIENFLPLVRKSGKLFGHDHDGNNDVAQGVNASGIKYSLPVPRLWASIKQ